MVDLVAMRFQLTAAPRCVHGRDYYFPSMLCCYMICGEISPSPVRGKGDIEERGRLARPVERNISAHPGAALRQSHPPVTPAAAIISSVR